ncbi:MAG: acyltransferase [Candidatus Mcinerneyibacterium aminivorans]|jgi:predicted amidohydrolase|uniref:Acyltransferase n=1 Tax=Candidatus Mcinerneyibacterium aminivorans TaxID=2703815 RepID=A0A5D0MJE0_9BACT|nr:MAG: acyltransferase [Candidatus Mcinerneyibacterium aminivorans]
MKAGFYQGDIALNNIQKNIDNFYREIRDESFDLIVLPELYTTGYKLSIEEVQKYSEPIPGGRTVDSFKEISEKTNSTIVWGMAEKDKNKYYNSAVIVNKGNYIGKYRKIHLFLNEKDRFSEGEMGFPVFEIGDVKIGLMICFDWIFPEAARTLALKKAQIITHPANLVLPYCQSVMPARSIENRVFCITANRIGKERGLEFTGKSVITNPKGEYLSKAKKEKVTDFVNINPKEADDKNVTEKNNIFDDRRPDYYL